MQAEREQQYIPALPKKVRNIKKFPCKECGVRMITWQAKSGMCHPCACKRWRKEHVDPEYRAKANAWRATWYARTKDARKEKERAARYRDRYGLTVEEVDELKRQQGHLCKICGLQRPLLIDHDHVTQKVRGAICHRCNIEVGIIEKASERMRQYIERSGAV